MSRVDNSIYSLEAEEFAQWLIGKIICKRQESGEILRMRIIESECYVGQDDSACHASRGKTASNSPLWLEGGHTYVYLCYGMYNMFNIVTGEADKPQGVLIRGVEGYYGPGKFTKFCSLDRSFNKIDMKSSNILWLEKDDFVPCIVKSKRVGIDYAEKKDRERLWRFTDKRFFKK